jgi:hypothetical protein
LQQNGFAAAAEKVSRVIIWKTANVALCTNDSFGSQYIKYDSIIYNLALVVQNGA